MKNQEVKIKKTFLLSPLQLGMIYECMESPQDNMYINQIKFSNLYNKNCIEKAIDILNKRYPILTSNILYTGILQPRLVIFENKDISFKYIKKDNINIEDTGEEYVRHIIKDEAAIEIDFQRKPLFRVVYCELDGMMDSVIWTYHHIILDGWSVKILANEFINIWKKLINDEEINDEDLKDAVNNSCDIYESYIAWLNNQDKDKSLYYWKNVLEGYSNSNILPMCSYVPKDKKIYESYNETVSSEITDMMDKLSRKYNVTFSNILETAWGLLLSQYSGVDDVVFGKVVSGREAPVKNIDEQVGFFINTVPVRINKVSCNRLIDIVKATKKQGIESGEFSYCPLVEIQSVSEQKELINTIFVYENYYEEYDVHDISLENAYNTGDKSLLNDNEIIITSLKMKDITVEEMCDSTSYPLALYVSLHGKRLNVKITYNLSIYDKYKIINIYKRFIDIVHSIVINPNAEVSQLNICTKEEENKILNDFNATVKEYPCNKTVIDLFEEQVKKTPDNIAVRYGEDKMTYAVLNHKANRLAKRLKEFGVGKNDLVPLVTQRSIEMIVGIYGVLKASGAYVPIDLDYPEERVSFILDDCNAKVVLSYRAELKTIIPIINLEETESYVGDGENLPKESGPESLIYCMYTSGTTGKPKGVMNINKGLVNLLCYMQEIYPLAEEDVILQKTSYVFDASFWELTWWGVTGASVALIPPRGEKDPTIIYDEIVKYGVTTLQFVPSMLNMFLTYLDGCMEKCNFSKIKYIFSIGEALNVNTVNKIRDIIDIKNKNIKLINQYGPTEASVAVTYFECKQKANMVPIGKPMSNIQIYILNQKRLCGIGIPGELYIAGDGLALGYLNRKELTDEKFKPTLYGNGKMYSTGDMARWLPDGNIEFLGRIDEQVKIRGCLVELGEIENQICKIKDVKACAVISKADDRGIKSIYAYLVSDSSIDILQIKKNLGKFLPEYMIPAYIGQIEKIPVTINGKLDKKALPEINGTSNKEYVAPRSDIEKTISGIYSKILCVEQVGIDDSFFELGGHSLRAILLINRIEDETGIRLAVHDIFEYPSVRELAKKIVLTTKKNQEKIPKAQEKEYYAMSSTQKRIYIVSQIDNSSLAYNIPEMFRLNGKVDESKMKNAVIEMIHKYEIFRTEFISRAGELLQRIKADVEPDYEYVKFDDRIDSLIMKEFIRPFDLEKAPLFRVRVVCKEQCSLLLLDAHHIVSDEMSMRNFLVELSKLYNS